MTVVPASAIDLSMIGDLVPRWVLGGDQLMPLPAGTVAVHQSANPEYPLSARVYWKQGWDNWIGAGLHGDRRDDELEFPVKIVYVPTPGRVDMLVHVTEHLRSLPTTKPSLDDVRAYEKELYGE